MPRDLFDYLILIKPAEFRLAQNSAFEIQNNLSLFFLLISRHTYLSEHHQRKSPRSH